MSVRNICAAALTFVTLAGAAQAATYAATTFIDSETAYGACAASSAAACEANNRKGVENALGGTDGTFYALGLGGQLALGFAVPLLAPGAMVTFEEVTFGGAAGSGHFEAADVYAVVDDVATLVATIYNTTPGTTLQITQGFEYLRLVDATLREFSLTSSFDGFDVDSVTVVAAVPVPVGGALLLSGLGGLTLLRRRRKAA
ncbi:hypothetical protein ACFOM8_00635 [Paracoccus angustae]|uniref:VPLPA-CTERM protein sorting domain-containing protein n=1 Tax=Paracoccus angustae TaxID=1671480 RepID=A0ABV7TZ37_9RHOB